MSDVKYSAQWIRDLVAEKGAKRLDHHECAGCGHMVYYSFEHGVVYFNRGCHCGFGFSAPEPYTYDTIAHWLAMQESDEIRDQILQGLR